MSAWSRKLRRIEGGIAYWCPACDAGHAVNLEKPGPRWTWDGNVEEPTIRPSVAYSRTSAQNGESAPRRVLCHHLVTSGRLEFLPDSPHAFAGLTVDMPDWPVSVEPK